MAENILVVEDDAIVRLSISEALLSAGYVVTEARDGEQAHKHLNERRFDLVILDFVLPKVHGFNLIDEFRSKWRRTPLLSFQSRSRGDFGGTCRLYTKADRYRHLSVGRAG